VLQAVTQPAAVELYNHARGYTAMAERYNFNPEDIFRGSYDMQAGSLAAGIDFGTLRQ